MNPTDELELSYELSGAKAAGISFADCAALRKMSAGRRMMVSDCTTPPSRCAAP